MNRHLNAPGIASAEAFPNQDSSLLRTFLRANCLIRRLVNAAPAEVREKATCLLLMQA